MANAPISVHPTMKERTAAGKILRDQVSRGSHSDWTPSATRPDAVELLKRTDAGRVPELLPIRYGRMAASPFAFLRGAAALMALDLSTTPATGLRVHARTGDAARISGYLGKSWRFDEAIEKFAIRYADQTERDHAKLVKAIRAHRIAARTDVPR
ncbi:MAG: DUF2252 family protein [Candidatus Acidiferrales bacterium]